jgi:protein tyrosine phosphatase
MYIINHADHFIRKVEKQNVEGLRFNHDVLFFSGRIKCHQYWPNVLETNDYGLFSVRCRRERKENQLIYREFLFSNKEINEERTIYQIQTETWPDHGVPNDFASFVDFVLEIRELRKSKKYLPILVHCRSRNDSCIVQRKDFFLLF